MRGRYKTGEYKKCLQCGKEFYCSPSSFEKAKFCSRSCLGKWRYENGHSANLNKGVVHTTETKSRIAETMKTFWEGNQHPRKGIASWNKGIKLHYAVWNKGKELYWLKGEKAPNWKGGKTTNSEKIRKSPKYKQWRHTVFKRDGWTCQWCGQNGGNLTAHHIKSFRNFPKLVFHVDNGLTLCKECHKKTDNYAEKALLNPNA